MKNNFGLYDSIKEMLAANKPQPKQTVTLHEDKLAAYAKQQPGSVIGGVDFGSIKKQDVSEAETNKDSIINESASRANVPGFRAAQKRLADLPNTLRKEKEKEKIHASIKKADAEYAKYHKSEALKHHAAMKRLHAEYKDHDDLEHEITHNYKNLGLEKHQVHGALDEVGHIKDKINDKYMRHHDDFAHHSDMYHSYTGKHIKHKAPHLSEGVEEEIVEGIFSEDEIAALLEMEQLDELSAKTLSSYVQKNKADPKRAKTRGPMSKTQKAHIAKRDAGLNAARSKLDKHYEAEHKKSEANHSELIKHVHENMHDTLTHHGYKYVGGDGKHTLYAKHLKGTAVMNHAIVHHPIPNASNDQNKHVLSLRSTTGWQNANHDRYYVESHSHDYRSLNTKHDAMTKLHNQIKAHNDFHAEKAKDHWLYK